MTKPDDMQVLGQAQHEAWTARTLPPVEELPAGLWSVPVPIPDNPLRYTLCHLVPGGDGELVVVDPGWDTDEGWVALTAGLSAMGADAADVTGIVATHVHPDHHGLSARLQAASGSWIAMHPAEAETLPQRIAALAPGGRRRGGEWFLRATGAPEAEIAALSAGTTRMPAQAATMAEPDVLLDDGDLVPLAGRQLRAVWTPGHTPGHLCLQEVEARLLLTGDHVLPRITPNIGLYPGADRDALAQFLTSLQRVADYDDHDALPAHEWRFRGLAARSRELQDHHRARLQEVLRVVGELVDPTLWQVAERLTWSRPWAEIGMMTFGALAETGAHVRHLVERGELAWDAAGGQDDSHRPGRIRLAVAA